MSMRYWSPTQELLQASRTFDRLFDTFFGTGQYGPATDGGEIPTLNLPVDVLEAEDAYVLTASVPGFHPDQVEVTWHEGLLTIFAKAQPEAESGWLRRERAYGNWIRRLELPESVPTEKISASVDNGLLTVRVPKSPKPQPVRIPLAGNRQLES